MDKLLDEITDLRGSADRSPLGAAWLAEARVGCAAPEASFDAASATSGTRRKPMATKDEGFAVVAHPPVDGAYKRTWERPNGRRLKVHYDAAGEPTLTEFTGD